VRNTLVTALVACADRPKKPSARRFLLGLSSDELQFIAQYLGACILECEERCTLSPPHFKQPLPTRISADRELKLILLREYLCRAGVQGVPVPMSRQAVN
jgi:hypothetical protein